MTPTAPPAGPAFDLHGVLRSIVLNAVVPVCIYTLMRRYVSPSEVVALAAAAVFPLAYSISEIRRYRTFDLIALFALLGIAFSLIGLALFHSPKLLLIRESLFTVMLGLACWVSLLLPRPLMFYVGRQIMCGEDAAKRADFDAHWQYPLARYAHRLITIVWGSALLGEFALRVSLVYTLPPAFVLALSPLILGAITLATILWTFRFVRRAEQQGAVDRKAEG